MRYREFVVPSDTEMLATLGVPPDSVEDDPAVRTFRLASVAGDDILISYDVPGRSFRIQISSGEVTRLDLRRECATHLSVSGEDGALRVRVRVQSSDLAGESEVSVGSEIVVRDKLLMI